MLNRYIHYFDRFAWMPVFVVFIIMLGMTAHDFVNTPFATGMTETAGTLSFASTIWGFGIGWASLASDYVVYFPVETPAIKVFLWVYAGLVVVRVSSVLYICYLNSPPSLSFSSWAWVPPSCALRSPSPPGWTPTTRKSLAVS
jgi:hypothetical protein